MSELVLLGVIVALCVLLYLRERENRLERAKLMNALISKNAAELRDLEFVEKVKIPDVKQHEPSLIPEADLTDEEFEKHIQEINKN